MAAETRGDYGPGGEPSGGPGGEPSGGPGGEPSGGPGGEPSGEPSGGPADDGPDDGPADDGPDGGPGGGPNDGPGGLNSDGLPPAPLTRAGTPVGWHELPGGWWAPGHTGPGGAVLAFDFDGTLRAFGGRGPPAAAAAAAVAAASRHAAVAIFSNRADPAPVAAFVAALDLAAMREGRIPNATAYCLAGAWRKPSRDAWDHFCRAYDEGRVAGPVRLAGAPLAGPGYVGVAAARGPPRPRPRGLFVGDAAGRPGDVSSDDLRFAAAAGLAFCTPEFFFAALGAGPGPALAPAPAAAHAAALGVALRTPAEAAALAAAFAGGRHVLLVGAPGAGKTALARELARDRRRAVVSRDDCAGEADWGARLRAAAARGPVVADRTHATAAARAATAEALAAGDARALEPAGAARGVAVVVLDVPRGDCLSRNEARARPVPRAAVCAYFKRLERPAGDDVLAL